MYADRSRGKWQQVAETLIPRQTKNEILLIAEINRCLIKTSAVQEFVAARELLTMYSAQNRSKCSELKYSMIVCELCSQRFLNEVVSL